MEPQPASDVGRTGVVVAGKFRLDAIIGRGGMGSVWSATHLGLGNQIAIKLVSREFVRSPEALRRFDAEAKAAARLQSRHVVQVYDNGTLEDGTPYIAMELLSGENLQQRIERTGPLPLAETVSILTQCCKALGRAHSLGIVHRDIKPDNIFLTQSPDDEAYVVKILDFGVAKLALGDGDQSTTKTGTVLGTPLYMSPEQARGLRGIDHRTDLYSLGLVAYTMLTGHMAFYSESFGDILLKICTEPLPSIRASANVPERVDAWFQHVCAREPAARCASAQEFIDTLRAAAGVDGARPSVLQSGADHSGSSGTGRHVPPTLLESGAIPPRPAGIASAQSVAEANLTISAAGLPRSHVGLAVVISIMFGLVAVAGVALFVLSSRHRDVQTAASAGASTLEPNAMPSTAAMPSATATLVPLSPAAAPAAPASTSVAAPSAQGSHVPGPASTAKTTGHGAPPHVVSAPAPPATSAKPNAGASPAKIDLGY
ncbi:MAG TPA: protein kinase [Polyangiaceae bacterium]|jgi:serine/threonine-protein kinase|nr:protein kinase [Polyangiaceae bacterium]